MVEILIETYRGWEISFHLHNETFSTYSNHYDKEFTKPTLSAVRAQIDAYLKINQKFERIEIMRSSTMFNNNERSFLVGIRKDKNFSIEKNGKIQQLSAYEEKDWFLVDHRNEPILKEIEEVEAEINKLQEKRRTLEASLFKVTVKDIKKELIAKHL